MKIRRALLMLTAPLLLTACGTNGEVHTGGELEAEVEENTSIENAEASSESDEITSKTALLSSIQTGAVYTDIETIAEATASALGAQAYADLTTIPLYTPTQLSYHMGYYFIEDCWNNRILYCKTLSSYMPDWQILTDDLDGGHTVADDGTYLVMDDSDHNRILAYRYDERAEAFIQTDEMEIDNRPHYVLYDEERCIYYVLSSYGGTISEVTVTDGKLALVGSHDYPNVSYTRSISILDGSLYMVTGTGFYYVIDYQGDWTVTDTETVCDEFWNMNYLTKIGSYYYLTSYIERDGSVGSHIARAQDLSAFSDGGYEELTDTFGLIGTPYFIAQLDHGYSLGEIDGTSHVYTFDVVDDEICHVRRVL